MVNPIFLGRSSLLQDFLTTAPGGFNLKDIVPRYFTMKGRYVERRFAGLPRLPIEHEIDKIA